MCVLTLGRLRIFLTCLILLAFTQACTSSLNSYARKSLKLSFVTYDKVLTVAGDVYKQGQMSEELKDDIIAKGRAYKKYHNLAVMAFDKYDKSGLEEDRLEGMEQYAKAMKIFSELMELAYPYIQRE